MISRLFALMIAFLGILSTTAGAAVVVFTIDGSTHEATTARLSEDGASLILASPTAGGESGTQQLPVDGILAIHFPSRPLREAGNASEVVLANGDIIAGTIESGDEFDLRILSEVGPLKVPIDRVRSIRFPAMREVTGLRSEMDAGSDEADVLLRRTGKGLDIVEGTLISFGPNGLVFSGPVGNYPFRYNEIAALVLMDTGADDLPEIPARHVTLRLRDRTRLTGTIRAMDDERVRIETALVGTLDIPSVRVSSIGFRSESFVHLSDLEPMEVRETPYFGDDSGFLYPYRRDVTVSGAPLVMAGRRYEKGLGVHSRSRVTFDRPEGFARFHATVGVSDEVTSLPARGRVVFRVLLDGKAVFETPVVQAGSEPITIPGVELGNAARLTLELDFGDDSDAGDRGIWAHAVLVRDDS